MQALKHTKSNFLRLDLSISPVATPFCKNNSARVLKPCRVKK